MDLLLDAFNINKFNLIMAATNSENRARQKHLEKKEKRGTDYRDQIIYIDRFNASAFRMEKVSKRTFKAERVRTADEKTKHAITKKKLDKRKEAIRAIEKTKKKITGLENRLKHSKEEMDDVPRLIIEEKAKLPNLLQDAEDALKALNE